ncbi:MAG: virulence factor [Hyphomicrobiaceae bacterium]|nr:virulence factor [Hyphomicrobiaceae bacterium]
MYAISFDLDTATLQDSYGSASWRNAYLEIRNALQSYGFEWQQGSVYFGGDGVDPVTCVLAVQDLTDRYAWFGPSVRDIRMLRIEDNNDLRPAIERALKTRRPA